MNCPLSGRDGTEEQLRNAWPRMQSLTYRIFFNYLFFDPPWVPVYSTIRPVECPSIFRSQGALLSGSAPLLEGARQSEKIRHTLLGMQTMRERRLLDCDTQEPHLHRYLKQQQTFANEFRKINESPTPKEKRAAKKKESSSKTSERYQSLSACSLCASSL